MKFSYKFISDNDIIKDYSNEFIEFLIKSNKELKKGGKKNGRN